MGFVKTTSVSLQDSDQQPASSIFITPKPKGSSSSYFFSPAFDIENQNAVVIELKVSIVNTSMFQFGISQAISKTYLINSENIQPIGFTLTSLDDFTIFPFVTIKFQSREFQSGEGFHQDTEQFSTNY